MPGEGGTCPGDGGTFSEREELGLDTEGGALVEKVAGSTEEAGPQE